MFHDRCTKPSVLPAEVLHPFLAWRALVNSKRPLGGKVDNHKSGGAGTIRERRSAGS